MSVEAKTARANLTVLRTGDLHAEWRRLYRTSPPRISRDFLARAVAHKLQEEHGGLDRTVARKLQRLVATLKGSNNLGAASLVPKGGMGTGEAASVSPTMPLPSVASRLRPGTRLVREWGGRTHVVEVVAAENGGMAFDHAGRRYGSLSEVARAITGARWSGPRFFGLVRRMKLATGPSDTAEPANSTEPADPTIERAAPDRTPDRDAV